MSGKTLMIGLLLFCAVFGAALYWFQIYAYYERVSGQSSVVIADVAVQVRGYEGIDAATSPLKMRGCFRLNEAPDAPIATQPEPLSAPFWFECFDHEAITDDLAAGRATAFVAGRNDPEDFDRIIAYYPDGRALMWRQINECGAARYESQPLPQTCK